MACVNNIVLYVSSTAWQGIIKTTFCRNSPMYALCFHLDLKCLFIEAFDNFFPSFRRVISHILRFSKYLRCNLTLLQLAVQVIHDKSSWQKSNRYFFKLQYLIADDCPAALLALFYSFNTKLPDATRIFYCSLVVRFLF